MGRPTNHRYRPSRFLATRNKSPIRLKKNALLSDNKYFCETSRGESYESCSRIPLLHFIYSFQKGLSMPCPTASRCRSNCSSWIVPRHVSQRRFNHMDRHIHRRLRNDEGHPPFSSHGRTTPVMGTSIFSFAPAVTIGRIAVPMVVPVKSRFYQWM